MTTIKDLKRAWNRANWKSNQNEGRPAILGNHTGDIYFTDGNGVTHGDRVWIRYVEADGTLIVAVVRNSGLPAALGLPVLVVNRNDVLTAIIDEFGNRMTVYTDGGGWMPQQQHAPTHERFGIDPLYIDPLMVKMLLVRPSSPPALTVYVTPGWYDWNGNVDVWEGGDTGSLSAYVPLAADTVHFIIVCIDSATNMIVIVDGDDVVGDGIFDTADVGYADIEAVTIPDDYIPLAVVELATGQTTIGVYSITYDLRRWMAKGGAGGFAADTNAILVDSNGDVLSDSNGNVLVESA